MTTEIINVNGRDFYKITSDGGGALRCIETGELFVNVYVPTTTMLTFEELENETQISDTEALNIITGRV